MATTLVVLPSEHLLPTCTTWLLLRRDRLLRDHTMDLIAQMLPGVDARSVRRAIETGSDDLPLTVPHWRDPDNPFLRRSR